MSHERAVGGRIKRRPGRVDTPAEGTQARSRAAEATQADIVLSAHPRRLQPGTARRLIGRVPNQAMQRLVGDAGGPLPAETAATITAQAGRGQVLNSAERSPMEGALGVDLSGVRLHTDAVAGELSDQLGARAFAVGSDVFFAAGEYQPGTHEGRHVLAHEVAHVAQSNAAPQSSTAMRVGAVDDPAEHQAEGVAQRVVQSIERGPASEAQTASTEEDQPAQDIRRVTREEEEERMLLLRRQPAGANTGEAVQRISREEEEERLLLLRRQTKPEEEDEEQAR